MHWIIAAPRVEQSGTSNFQLWGVPIIVGIVFYILGAVTTLYVKRPKIEVSGGGGGGSGAPTGFQTNNIRIRNTPGRVGVKIGQTVFFGFRLNHPHWFGFPVMREPATGCVARLLDEKKTHVAQLWWRDPENHSKRLTTVDLDSGREAELLLFAQRNDDTPNYYPYEPGPGDDPNIPIIKQSGTRRIIVQVSYSDGQKKRNFKYTVTNEYRDGRMNISAGWHS